MATTVTKLPTSNGIAWVARDEHDDMRFEVAVRYADRNVSVTCNASLTTTEAVRLASTLEEASREVVQRY
jgi:hypothetical protein